MSLAAWQRVCLPMLVLDVLAVAPRHGYGISQALVSVGLQPIKGAQLYPALVRLEDDGAIASRWEQSGSGPARKVYELTAAGRRALHAWLVGPDLAHEVRDEGLLKLFFADALERDEGIELVRTIRATRRGKLERLREIEARIPAGARAELAFPLLCLEFGIGVNEWTVQWCDDIERRLARAGREEATVS